MKKLSLIAAVLFTMGMASCSNNDNAVEAGEQEPEVVIKTAEFVIEEGATYTSGQEVEVESGVVSIVFGEEGGSAFSAAVANGDVEGFTAYTAGNGVNGNKAGGSFYTIKTAVDGVVTVAVVLNADKKFFIEEDGTALEAYNGITESEKYFGTYSFTAKAGSSYKIYGSGTKLGFYGFNFVY